MTETPTDAVEAIKKKLPPNWFYYAVAILGVLAVIAGCIWYFYKRKKGKEK